MALLDGDVVRDLVHQRLVRHIGLYVLHAAAELDGVLGCRLKVGRAGVREVEAVDSGARLSQRQSDFES